MITNNLFAHGGGVDINGCHVQKSTGKEHCHGAKKCTKDAKDVDLADLKERHRNFSEVFQTYPTVHPHMVPTASHVEKERLIYKSL